MEEKYQLEREGEERILTINYEDQLELPSLEDSATCMATTMDSIINIGNVTKIVFTQKRDFEYDYAQTRLLLEIATIFKTFVKRKFMQGLQALLADNTSLRAVRSKYAQLQKLFYQQLKSDPIGAYVELRRILRLERIEAETYIDASYVEWEQQYIGVLSMLQNALEQTTLIRLAAPHLEGFKIGSREVYRLLFSPTIKPDFMFTKLQASYPSGGIVEDSYSVKGTEVTMFRFSDSVRNLYHIIPPEFLLTEDQYELLDLARNVMAEHKPTKKEFVDPEQMREIFMKIGRDLLEDLASSKEIELKDEEFSILTEILVRYTVGFGLIEVLLQDEKVQDISINSPQGRLNIFIVHQDYGDCYTNIIPTPTEVESWASKLRMISGRPLDESNQILDTELELPGATARVSAISAPLDPTGLAYSFRRHRDKPWTLPLFVKCKMINPLAAGLISFLVDGTRTMLVSGTRSSGKSSFLGSILVEIMRRYRIITIEDSVTGDAEIVFKRKGIIEKTTVGALIDSMIDKYGTWYKLLDRDMLGSNPEQIEVMGMDKEGKVSWNPVSRFIRHKVQKQLYKITTRTGRHITVTGDHSLFTLGENGEIEEIKGSDCQPGSFLATPRSLPLESHTVKSFTMLPLLDKLPFVRGKALIPILQRHKQTLIALGEEFGYTRSIPHRWARLGVIPGGILSKFLSLTGAQLPSTKELRWTMSKNSKGLSCFILASVNLLTCVGLWLGDGCFDKNSVLISSSSEEERAVIRSFASEIGKTVKRHSDTWTEMIHSKELKFFFQEALELHGGSYTKRIPSWVYQLSDEQKGYVLKGVFSADSCPHEKEISISLASRGLLSDIQTLLLSFGIILRIGKIGKDKTYNARISTVRDFKLFARHVGVLQNYKKERLRKLCEKISTHDSSDVVPLSIPLKKYLVGQKQLPYHDYVTRNYNIGRSKFQACITEQKLKYLSETDLYWDSVKTIEKVPLDDTFVYDFSVPGCESFVCNNIIAHNTLELPVKKLLKLGYNIQQMKVAGALAKEGSEMTATDGIRATLRLGDSALFVGEVRSSLRGNEEVVVIENGSTKRMPIQSLEGKNVKSFSLPTLDENGKMNLHKLTGFVKHPKRSQLIKIITETGREVTVTPDHSVFTHENFKITPINTDQLKERDHIIIPSRVPCGFNDINHLNLLEIFKEDYRLEHAETYIREAIKVIGWRRASKICGVSDIYRYLLSTQKTRIPINAFLKLMKVAKIKYELESLRIKRGTSNSIPAKFPINSNTMRLVGYYLAEGNIDKNGIQITNSKEKIIADVLWICENELGLKVKCRMVYGKGSSVQMLIQSKPLVDLFLHLDCGRTSLYKRIPSLVYGLNKKKICALLRGMYSGDGSISITKRAGTMIRYFSTAKKLTEDVGYALLCIGIVCRFHGRKLESGKTLTIAEIKQRKYVEIFLREIGFTHKNPKNVTKAFAHSRHDSVVFDPKVLEKHLKLPRKYRHLRRTKCCSKEYLKRITEEVKCSDKIYDFAHGDFFVDKVKSIEVITLKKPEYVYDLSVKSTERFIGGFGGILLHNTEAVALYEAMRVGAAANVVAGTIHADSPYGVFDRVVNDIGVPRTSFKATDIIIVANPIKTASSIHKLRRITTITEIRKHWENDPLLENGFVDLMKYNVDTDTLEPTPALLNGDSEVLKAIAGNIKGLAGNWDAVWDDIQLRARIKEALVKHSLDSGHDELLEAAFVVKSNDVYHNIVGKIQEETGKLDASRAFVEWDAWIRREVKKLGD